ncbi:hypothetical protein METBISCDRAFT_21137 [Metschnikowia bicuspidata]|uniref:Uncharacterized protein n=1 Tax=Metschnikowia bicuspidata TaxID=27322 RepID=A0A4P9ZI62_9ASCO|nr:hypothetical protein METBISCDRAFT_21137 [Metschnikowia bicuspidata]
MPSPTIYLHKRDASLSSGFPSASASLDCSGKNSKLPLCEKSTPSNGLEIALGAGIPLVVILLVLSFLIVRNYRKEKREAMDHDPDFDENGHPTALPDLPAFTKSAHPFAQNQNHFAGIGGYPLMELQNKFSQDVKSVERRSTHADSIVDGFVLPYRSQTGSKASLDHFARQLGDCNNYKHKKITSNHSTASIHNQQVMSLSRSNFNISTSNLNTCSRGGSPQKSRGGGYSTKNGSNTLIPYNDTAFDVSLSLTEGFRINIENKPESEPVRSLPSSKKGEVPSAKAYAATKEVSPAASEIMSVHDAEDDSEDERYRKARSDPIRNDRGISEPTADDYDDYPDGTDDLNTTTGDFLSPFDEKFDNQLLSQQTESSEPDKLRDDSEMNLPVDDTHESQSETSPKKKPLKEARMSFFNMLQNVSDDDEADSTARDQKMTEEQELELARIKSVYKIYFDKSNSMKSVGDVQGPSFQPDSTQPTPSLAVDHLQAQTSSDGKPAYDPRGITASLIYEEPSHMHMDQENNFGNSHLNYPQSGMRYNHGQYVDTQNHHNYTSQRYQPEQQFYNDEGYNFQYQQQYPAQPSENRHYYNTSAARLPNASEIRKSSVQTFTNFEPKPGVSSSRSVKQQEFSNNTNSLNISASSFALPSAVLMTTGSPTTLQRKYKPADAFLA